MLDCLHAGDIKAAIADKNNVDIEKEIADEVKNTLHYSAVTTAVGNSFKRLKSVLA